MQPEFLLFSDTLTRLFDIICFIFCYEYENCKNDPSPEKRISHTAQQKTEQRGQSSNGVNQSCRERTLPSATKSGCSPQVGQRQNQARWKYIQALPRVLGAYVVSYPFSEIIFGDTDVQLASFPPCKSVPSKPPEPDHGKEFAARGTARRRNFFERHRSARPLLRSSMRFWSCQIVPTSPTPAATPPCFSLHLWNLGTPSNIPALFRKSPLRPWKHPCNEPAPAFENPEFSFGTLPPLPEPIRQDARS